jgi:hypothetical protein
MRELDESPAARRVVVAALLNHFCHNTSVDLESLVGTLLRGILGAFVDPDKVGFVCKFFLV